VLFWVEKSKSEFDDTLSYHKNLVGLDAGVEFHCEARDLKAISTKK